MAGSSRRKSTQKSGISYAEVDSDVDMQEDQKQVQASKAKSAKEKARKPKKRARTVDTEGEQVTAAPQQSLEGFLELPLDVLSEVCSHLDPADLIKLSRTSKLFRSLLLSRDSRHIWLAARRAAKLPEIKDLDELNYALLLHGSSCSNCGETSSSVDRDYALRLKLCDPCKKELLTSENHVKKVASGPVHGHTLLCIPASSLKTPGHRQRWMTFYLTSDVLEVNRVLLDLQEDDDIAQDAWTSRRLSTGTRTRKAKEAVEAPESLVDAFVKEKRAEAAARVDERKSITDRLRHNAAEERDRIRNEQEAVWNDLKLDLEVNEWLDEEIEWYEKRVFRARWRSPAIQLLARPSSSRPSPNPDDWKAIREQVQAYIEEQERQNARNEAWAQEEERKEQRSKALRPFFEQLRKAQPQGHSKDTFPPFEPFQELQHVAPLWEPEDSQDSPLDASWQAALDNIKADVEAYRETRRVAAIRLILSATNDVPLSTLSTDPADYDEADYGDDFFNKITSHFYHTYSGWSPYPKCLRRSAGTNTWWGVALSDYEVNLGTDMDRRRTLILRAILQAARLNEETATLQDVLDLGSDLQWPDHPRKSYRSCFWSPVQMMTEILHRVRDTKKHPFPQLIFKLRDRHGRIPTAPSQESSNSEEEDSEPDVKPRRKARRASTEDDSGSAQSGDEQDQDIDSASSDDESVRPRVKKARPVKVKNMSDSEGEDDMDLDDEMDEQGSSLAADSEEE